MSKTWYGHHIETIKGEDYVLFKNYLELDKEIEKLTAESTEWESKCYDLQEELEGYKQERENLFASIERIQKEIDEFDKWLIGEKMMFYKSDDGERLIRFGETKYKWLELKGDNK